MSMYGSCSLCGEEILEADARDVHDQIISWHTRRPRRGGGHHDKGKLWRTTGAVAHGRCVESAKAKAKAGTSIHQGGLF
jgi:hypothetical protein